MATYLSLEDAAKKLGISTDKLVDLRSQGQIRGFRDGTSWKFPDTEIDRLRDELEGSADLSDDHLLGDSSLALGVLGDSELDEDSAIVAGGSTGDEMGSSGDSDVNLIAASGDDSDVAIVTSDSDLISGDSSGGLLEIDSSDLKIDDKAIMHDSAQLDLASEVKDGSTGPVTDRELDEMTGENPDKVENSGLDALSDLDLHSNLSLADEGSQDDGSAIGLDSNLSFDDAPSLDEDSISGVGLSGANLDLGIESGSGVGSSASSLDLDSGEKSSVAGQSSGGQSDLDLKAITDSASVLDSMVADPSGSLAGSASNLELMGDLEIDSGSDDKPVSGDLLSSSRGADVLSELDLLGAEQGSGLISEDSGDLLASSGLLAGSGLGSDLGIDGSDSGVAALDDALDDDDELVIADDDDDLVISSAGSDISVAGDSGINLMSPSDSGLSLESEPLDLAGSSISALDLGAELVDGSGSGIGSGSGVDAGSMVDFEADEEFQLSASGVGIEADSDSSQVIEIEDSQAIGEPIEFEEAAVMDADVFGDAAGVMDADPFGDAPAPDGGFGEEAVAVEVEADAEGAVMVDDSISPAMTATSAGVGYEIPFTLLQCVGLLLTICVMCVGGMLMTDLARNMWTYSEVSAPVSSLTDLLMSWL